MTNFWISLPWYISGTICTIITFSLIKYFKDKAEESQNEDLSTEAPWRHETDNWLEDDEEGKPVMRIKVTHAKAHPSESLANLIFYTIAAFVCYSHMAGGPTWNIAIFTAGAWCILTIVLDFLCWIALHFIDGFTLHEAYIEEQPWITLNYFAIYLSPLFAFTLYALIS